MANSSNKGQSVTQALVGVRNAGTSQAISHFIHTNPEAAATVTKLIQPKTSKTFDSKGRQEVATPRIDSVLEISQRISQKTSDAKAVMQLFPDVRLAAEIMVVSIISPNDMFNQEIIVSVPDNLYCGPLANTLQPLIKEYIEKTYKLTEKLPDIIYKAMFDAGAYPIVVIPESSLDDIINGEVQFSKESALARSNLFDDKGHLKNLGRLGGEEEVRGGVSFGLEAWTNQPKELSYDRSEIKLKETIDNKTTDIKTYVRVVDNPQTLKLPTFTAMAREAAYNQTAQRTQKSGSVTSGLDAEAMNDRELMGMLYQSTRRSVERMVKVKTQNETARFTVGRPLVLDLPPESVIPVISTGSEKDHVGYFIPINSEGQPITRRENYDSYGSLKKSAFANKDLTSSLLSRTASYFNAKCDDLSLQQGARIFQDIVEASLMARLRNGMYGGEVDIASTPALYQMMLFRALQQKETQLLFIPAEMLVYFTFDYNEDGTGKSLIEDIRVIASARAQTLLARVVGGIKNAIGRTKVNVEIDDGDSDRLGTFEMIKTEVLRQRSSIPAASSLVPNEIMAQNAALGIEFETNGGPGLPATKVGFSETNSNYTRPDTDLDEILTEYLVTGIGVPPELVVQAKQMDFATIADNNNLLMAKRTEAKQKIIEPQLTKLVRSMTMADGIFMKDLKDTIKANLDKITKSESTPAELKKFESKPDYLVHLLAMEFLSNFGLELSRPNVKSRQNQLENMELYEQMITKALDAVIGPDAMDASIVGEEMAKRATAMYSSIKAALIRREMRNTNFADEALDIATEDDKGNVIHDVRTEIKDHQRVVSENILNIAKDTSKVADATTVELSKIQTPDPTSDGGSSIDGSGGSFGDGDGGSDTSSGGDGLGDLGNLDDIPLS